MSETSHDRSLRRRAPGLALRGVAMGTADVIPGVSGGTMALITGIYDELVGTVASIDQNLLTAVLRGRWREAWERAAAGHGLVTDSVRERRDASGVVWIGLVMRRGSAGASR